MTTLITAAKETTYHAAANLDLKRGWTGIHNVHAISRMHNLFEFIVLARQALFQIQNGGYVTMVHYIQQDEMSSEIFCSEYTSLSFAFSSFHNDLLSV